MRGALHASFDASCGKSIAARSIRLSPCGEALGEARPTDRRLLRDPKNSLVKAGRRSGDKCEDEEWISTNL